MGEGAELSRRYQLNCAAEKTAALTIDGGVFAVLHEGVFARGESGGDLKLFRGYRLMWEFGVETEFKYMWIEVHTSTKNIQHQGFAGRHRPNY